LNSDDPIKQFYENYANYGIEANKVFITVAKDIEVPSEQGTTANEHDPHHMEQTLPLDVDIHTTPLLPIISTPLETTVPLGSVADMQSLINSANVTDIVIEQITPLEASTDTQSSELVGSLIETTVPLASDMHKSPMTAESDFHQLIIPPLVNPLASSNISSTNSAGFQQLTSFTAAMDTPLIFLSSNDKESEQQPMNIVRQ
jgi:hypothetical protein